MGYLDAAGVRRTEMLNHYRHHTVQDKKTVTSALKAYHSVQPVCAVSYGLLVLLLNPLILLHNKIILFIYLFRCFHFLSSKFNSSILER